ncbi:MAG: Outer membrane protein assembly factor BamD [Formosa sp. Hel3_A1_48]|jgi:outer membrane protein assembly factor BamD|nr:MAG: Outer membrane protein assembly factor BamD [Formosa sp. Hel3_A1_48]
MRKLISLLVLCVFFSSCSEYQRVLKEEDVAAKFKMGTELYDAGKYEKANRLFLQIVPKYRGKPQAEKLMYMHSKAFYLTKDYFSANYRMERFVEAYPKSERVDEIAFLAAKSYYKLSPIYPKDQTETVEGLEKLQEFINRYPESQYFAEANALVQELDGKLEKKAYEIALQYHTTAPFHRDYNSAITAFDNFLEKFPGTKYKEDVLYYKFDSAYQLAINSVPWKQAERTEKAFVFYKNLKRFFPDTKYLEQTESMHSELLDIKNNLTTKS